MDAFTDMETACIQVDQEVEKDDPASVDPVMCGLEGPVVDLHRPGEAVSLNGHGSETGLQLQSPRGGQSLSPERTPPGTMKRPDDRVPWEADHRGLR